MSTIEEDTLSAAANKVELLNKEDDQGHHYLKILLLSNKLNGNKWQTPYSDIKELPKQLLDSYLDLDGYPQHDNSYFLKLYNDLTKEGKSDDEIFTRFREESAKKSLGKVTQLFTEYTPSKELLFGEFKVTNKEWNEFIEKNKKPPYEFTSPALLGDYDITEDGNMIYHMDTARAFHIGFVPTPAFPPQEAKIRAICHSKDQKCRSGIAFASAEPPLVTAETDGKNLNTDTNNNTNIHMSNENNPQTPQVTAELRTDTNVPQVKMEERGYDKNSDVTAKLNTELRQSGEQQEKKEEELKEEIQQKTDKVNKELATAEERLAKLESDLKIARKEKEEQRNFILDKILLANIPRDNFKKDDEYDAEKSTVKTIINKYNMSYDDSEWFVKKAYPKAPVVEGKKGSNPLTAGLNTMFTPSSLTTTSSSEPVEQPKTFCPSNPLPVEF